MLGYSFEQIELWSNLSVLLDSSRIISSIDSSSVGMSANREIISIVNRYLLKTNEY